MIRATWLRHVLLAGGVSCGAWLGGYCATEATHAMCAALIRDEVLSWQKVEITHLHRCVEGGLEVIKRQREELADTQRRLDGCRAVIVRYREELAQVEQLHSQGGAQ